MAVGVAEGKVKEEVSAVVEKVGILKISLL